MAISIPLHYYAIPNHQPCSQPQEETFSARPHPTAAAAAVALQNLVVRLLLRCLEGEAQIRVIGALPTSQKSLDSFEKKLRETLSKNIMRTRRYQLISLENC